MKLREKTNMEISEENDISPVIMSNVVEEKSSKNKMRATSNLIAKALISTLGPYGSATIIQDPQQKHFGTKDGYDLMGRITFDDPVAKTILDLFRQTAANQVFSVGDGSTSAIVVANALFQALTDPDNIEHFEAVAPKDIIDILNQLGEMVTEELKKMAIPVSEDMHELDVIAAVANNNDDEAGKLIADIYRQVGRYGFIAMDTADKQDKDTFEIKSGIEWDRGYIDPVFPKMYGDETITYENNPRVIISNSALTYDDLQTGLMPLIQNAINQSEAELLIVANDFDADVLNFLKANRTKHATTRSIEMKFTAVDIDQVTKESRNKLEDLAMLCGCTIYDKVVTQKADIIAHPEKYVGHAAKIIITPKHTQVIRCDEISKDYQKAIDKKVAEISEELEKLMNNEDHTMSDTLKIYELRSRKSRLTSSTAILHVGGKTMTERTTRQRLIEDAIFACKSALDVGYIPGGNICIPKILLNNKERYATLLGAKYNYLPIESIHGFFGYFIDIIANAFLESYRAVLNNSYLSESKTEEVIQTCLNEGKFYNLKLHKFEDWAETKIINSVNTDVEILNSCISIIGILATSNQFLVLGLNVNDYIKK